MKIKFIFPKWLLPILVGLMLAIMPSDVLAECDYEPDAPDCPCFIDTGVWDPNGVYIQDVANATYGTMVSCRCFDPGDPTCDWDPAPTDPDENFTDSGKPYYQMMLGNDEPFSAFSAAVMLSQGLGDDFRSRGAWCSETVSYWHKHTFIPYAGGYRCDRHMDWMLSSAYRIVNWYTVERALREITGGEQGRGWFIHSHEVDLAAFELGVTVPVPGAYIGIKDFERDPDRWGDWDRTGHSLIVDEMVAHRDGYGNVFQVDLTLLQGNSGNPPQVTGGRWDDFESFLPRGSGWLGSRKIFGFGIDLDATGNPIYDPTRLHYVDHPFVVMIPPVQIQKYDDPDSDPIALQKAYTYAMFLKDNGGPGVSSSSKAVAAEKVPDGVNTQWVFPKGLKEAVSILIDLRTEHPTAVQGIELVWKGPQPPVNYGVSYAGANSQYQSAHVPDLQKIVWMLPKQASVTVVPISFTQGGPGASVRYVKISFPPETFSQQEAVLQELRFVYDSGPVDDAKINSGKFNYTMDCGRAYPSKSCLWPANGDFVEVQVKGVKDAAGNSVSPRIFAISSDEPTAKGIGTQIHDPQAFGLDSDTVHLRAERSDKGDGRVYNVHFFADSGAKRCKGSVEVRVPLVKPSDDCPAVDSGQYYDATGVNPGACVPSGTRMCLNKSRFQIEVSWKAQDGRIGVGQAVPFGSDDSGMFWFFDNSNWEMLIKVLDGCAINDHYWVFFAATTDQEFTVTVTDTFTGDVRQYTNLMKHSADAVTDTSAFATCSEATSTFGLSKDLEMAFPTPKDEQIASSYESSESFGFINQVHSGYNEISLPEAKRGVSWQDNVIKESLFADSELGDCLSSETVMCLNQNRFMVEVDWKSQDGRAGSGKVVPCGTDESGMFWFFSATNWEMLIKILDGCSFNDNYWVFFAATTDQEFTVTVTDTLTSEVVQYTNPMKHPANAVTDTSAFATCP